MYETCVGTVTGIGAIFHIGSAPGRPVAPLSKKGFHVQQGFQGKLWDKNVPYVPIIFGSYDALMYLTPMTDINNGMVIHENNPFKDDILRMLDQSKNKNITKTYTDGSLSAEEVTVTYRKEYIPFPFTKVFQNKELLSDLDPWACKIMIYMALNLSFNQQRIQLNHQLVGIDKRKFSKTMVDLMGRRILVKEKREWYWVNITILIVGNINKHESSKNVPNRDENEDETGQ